MWARIGILHEHLAKNPVVHVETRSKSSYRAMIITPVQTVALLKSLASPLRYTLVLTCAATALRSSEILALRWSDMLWEEGRIRISKRWAKGADGETKTDASDGYAPLHPVLAAHLRAWQRQTPHAKEADFVFPSMRARGRKPLCSSVFVADHLRPAAKKAGVHIEEGQRFGLHNLRHTRKTSSSASSGATAIAISRATLGIVQYQCDQKQRSPEHPERFKVKNYCRSHPSA